MEKEKVLGQIKIIDVIENNNGTCTISYEVPEALKEILKQQFGWKRWSAKRFNDFFLEALNNYTNNLEEKSKNIAVSEQRCIDVFDTKRF